MCARSSPLRSSTAHRTPVCDKHQTRPSAPVGEASQGGIGYLEPLELGGALAVLTHGRGPATQDVEAHADSVSQATGGPSRAADVRSGFARLLGDASPSMTQDKCAASSVGNRNLQPSWGIRVGRERRSQRRERC